MPLHYFKRNFLSPLLEFIHDSRAIGIIILLSTVLSLLVSNSAFGHTYLHFFNLELHISSLLPHSILHWINDGWMALFFLLAGMEIKRELIYGTLSSFKKSILPVMGALGGMLFPAIIYTLFNHQSSAASGWGIPMATDIAFSLGVASILGRRVSLELKIFLMALAIIDDLGAILAIALFYTAAIKIKFLIAAGVLYLLMVLWTKFNKPFGWWNIIAGIVLWLLIFNSGIHATIAGVLFAFTIPKSRLINWENKLHHSVNFIIIPLFVLANTAIILPPSFVKNIFSNQSAGIIAGLLIGKPLGILSFCWLAVKLKFGALSETMSWSQLTGLGILASIGFTMSIFISMLAFLENELQDIAKTSVMAASIIAIVLSYIWFRWILNSEQIIVPDIAENDQKQNPS